MSAKTIRTQSRPTASQNVGMPKSCCTSSLDSRAVVYEVGAQDRTRTCMPSRTADFKSAASTIPPPGPLELAVQSGAVPQRNHAIICRLERKAQIKRGILSHAGRRPSTPGIKMGSTRVRKSQKLWIIIQRDQVVLQTLNARYDADHVRVYGRQRWDVAEHQRASYPHYCIRGDSRPDRREGSVAPNRSYRLSYRSRGRA